MSLKAETFPGSRVVWARWQPIRWVSLFLALIACAHQAWAQSPVDPGVRGGAAGAGQFISNLNPIIKAVEGNALSTFTEVNRVTDPTAIKPLGLGPRFDSNSCSSCHAQPAIGGSSLATNPLFTVYQADGALNTMPSFELINGPVVVARFPFQSDGVTPDGTVHQLFTISGRSDVPAPGCNIQQPDFASAQSSNNLALRQATPMFGDGYVEIIQDSDIIANMNSNLTLKQELGITGTPNLATDGSISRLGWKAQTRSLLLFAAEAYSIEEGVSNEMFPNKLDETPGCIPPYNTTENQTAGVPDDRADYDNSTTVPVSYSGDPERLAIFARILDQPRPAKATPSTSNGQVQFNNVGCVQCHTTSFTTPVSSLGNFSKIQANLFSDLLLHHMGPCLADNVVQGKALGDMFRTAPLWGVGQRIFFLNDGRTSNIVTAVEDHFCAGNTQYPASEANGVINNFNALSLTNQQDLINFLRSL